MLVAAGADVSGRVFTPEEVSTSLAIPWQPTLPPTQLAGKLILDRRKFQLGVVEVGL